MNINLHIERLILDGISLPYHQQSHLQAAMEAELARLLAEGSLQPDLTASGAVASLSTQPIHVSEGGKPDQLGQRIAQSIYGGIGR